MVTWLDLAPDAAERAIEAGLEVKADRSSECVWGRFDVRIDGASRLLPVVAWFMNLRSRVTGIATGDQAIFVRRREFPGFLQIPLMEDIAFSGQMKRISRPACLRPKAVTSGRRWERHGVLRTILLMWRLRLAYWLGAPPEELARRYAKAG